MIIGGGGHGLDLTPDSSPIMGETPVAGYYIDDGWGTWGFKAMPVAGRRMAEAVATGRTPDLIRPFRLERFREMVEVGERGAGAAGA